MFKLSNPATLFKAPRTEVSQPPQVMPGNFSLTSFIPSATLIGAELPAVVEEFLLVLVGSALPPQPTATSMANAMTIAVVRIENLQNEKIGNVTPLSYLNWL